jgi:hypothetical protein
MGGGGMEELAEKEANVDVVFFNHLSAASYKRDEGRLAAPPPPVNG